MSNVVSNLLIICNYRFCGGLNSSPIDELDLALFPCHNHIYYCYVTELSKLHYSTMRQSASKNNHYKALYGPDVSIVRWTVYYFNMSDTLQSNIGVTKLATFDMFPGIPLTHLDRWLVFFTKFQRDFTSHQMLPTTKKN